MRAKQGTEVATAPDGPPRVAGREPCRPADVRNAVRRVVDRQCRTAGAAYDVDGLNDALLVASELTTNAILHGGGVTHYEVDVEGRGVRVSVCDRSEREPVATACADARGRRRTGGRGWPVVCMLSREVRVSGLPAGGKRITAVVAVF